jgi:hypothetical protein
MILETMLQRLFASLVHGPSMNARPHRSRQRCDWTDLAAFGGTAPETALGTLLDNRKVEFPAKVPPFTPPPYPEPEWSAEQKQARDAHQKQSRLLKKLRDIADDALEYVNDHGESCLALGFPLVSLAPAADEAGGRPGSRILAPLLLMPVNLQVRTASRPGVTIEAVGEGADLLVANPALIAWLERQTGKAVGEIYLDEEAADPWREVEELLAQINQLLELPAPPEFHRETVVTPVPLLEKLPKTAAVLPSAVLGLFPLSNQSLLRDTRWMIENEATLKEPVSAFLTPQALFEPAPEEAAQEAPVGGAPAKRKFHAEWLVCSADPCQANAVLAAREAKALVVHGPPGTGKSQTITNMIADHLARGERVLFVCDKRTALDVVKYRLDAVGLGHLCGVVHDPSGDRKDFYMGLRAQLENLADTPLPGDGRAALEDINRELAKTHAELERYRQKLHDSGTEGGASFHDLLGQWLKLALRENTAPLPGLTQLQPAQVQEALTTVDEVCRRADKAGYPTNPFRGLLDVSLQEFLTRPAGEVRAALEALEAAAREADAKGAAVAADALDLRTPVSNQAALRDTAAERLRVLAGTADLELAGAVFAMPEKKLMTWLRDQQQVHEWQEHIRRDGPLDRSLLSSATSAGILNLAVVNQHVAALLAWEAVHHSFLKRLFAGAVKKAAQAALTPLGLTLETGWQQGLSFYRGAKSRLLLHDWLGQCQAAPASRLPDDPDLEEAVSLVQTASEAVTALRALHAPAPELNQQALEDLAARLTAESQWATALDELMTLMRKPALFAADAPNQMLQRWLAGEAAAETTRAWQSQAATLEEMVRLNHALGQLSPEISAAVETLLTKGANFEELTAALTRQALENAVRLRLQRDSELAAIDGERIEAAFETLLRLSAEKLNHVRDHANHLWLRRQKERLLATTGTQLNKLGSALRQRLYVKGKKALKLRQMLATGADTEGGDAIFELCPVWMASPSTVAQIFPRQPIFDVVIFDEASQCRLEEALPVLLRGHRVVIAGDQKQLPPTRFFESALADSGDSDAETAEELFYQQQQEAEDLLTAALNLDVREAYLDVHYRSRNEDLIGFSNQQYYGSRLQPIPGHPRNKVLSAPIELHRVDGVYLERANVKEAEAAVDLIAKLLAEPQPPSIGVACFNLTQKEAIHDAIAERIGKDAEFARRYEEAKHRKGRDSFEGLFVKNLENVQGDERDVMIICTTFGPDPQGKFRRNFGALSQREGGRRLNVLVTRAREAIHVLTSIPQTEYASVEAVPPGQVPNGRLQLYAYLRYAEKLAALYEQHQDHLERMRSDAKPELVVADSATPSSLASGLGETLLKRHATGAHIHWGNDGFCVDVACIHPLMPADVTVGVLTDFSRFHKTPDPIEWDLFRTRVLRSQGWELERVWSPVLFRRLEDLLQRIKAAHDRLAVPPTAQQAAEAVLREA